MQKHAAFAEERQVGVKSSRIMASEKKKRNHLTVDYGEWFETVMKRSGSIVWKEKKRGETFLYVLPDGCGVNTLRMG